MGFSKIALKKRSVAITLQTFFFVILGGPRLLFRPPLWIFEKIAATMLKL